MERPDCMVSELGGTLAVKPGATIQRGLGSLWFPGSFWQGRNYEVRSPPYRREVKDGEARVYADRARRDPGNSFPVSSSHYRPCARPLRYQV